MQLRDRSMNLFFPTPVWSAVIEDHESLNARILEQLEGLDWTSLDEANRQTYGSDHTFREDRFITVDRVPATGEILGVFLGLCNEIVEHVNWKLGSAEMRITDYWYHVTEPEDVTQTHTHKPALLSGVYYVDKPEKSGHLVFIDQNPYHGYLPQIAGAETNPLLAAEVTVDVGPGAMVIFPSWLQHRVQRNESGKRRVSISFNAAPMPSGSSG